MTDNISRYIYSDDVGNYVARVLEIVRSIEEILQLQVYIFGGFIRRTIENNLDPSDIEIDIWLFSQLSKDDFLNATKKIMTMMNNKISILQPAYSMSPTHNRVVLLKDGFIFDINGDSSNVNSFNTVCDFTVNNLCMDTSGNIFTRIDSLFTYGQTIFHILQKKLVKMHLDDSRINELYGFLETYKMIMEQRTSKMIYLGYSFDHMDFSNEDSNTRDKRKAHGDYYENDDFHSKRIKHEPENC